MVTGGIRKRIVSGFTRSHAYASGRLSVSAAQAVAGRIRSVVRWCRCPETTALLYSQRLAEGQPAFLMMQARQWRARQRAEGLGREVSAGRAPCPARRHRRCCNADNATRRPLPVRSLPEKPHPTAGPTTPPSPPCATPASVHLQGGTSSETAPDSPIWPPKRI